MQDLDRKQTPQSKEVEALSVPLVLEKKLRNNMPVYILDSDNQDILRIDFVFNAGKWRESKNLLSSMTNAMLSAGTKTRSSAKIADELDFCGAHLRLDSGKHSSNLSLYTLKKHLSRTLPVFADIIKNAIFPADELENLLNNKRQDFIVSQEKIETLAFQQFNQLIYGEEHPYGKLIEPSDFRKIKTESVQEYYNTFYTHSNGYIIISGKTDASLFSSLDELFGENQWREESPSPEFLAYTPNDEILYYPRRELFLGRHGVKQSSIRMGNLSISENHPDFAKLKVVNTVLGGYFGSRLMTNIREDKGYTYSIGSSLVPGPEGGSFVIGTEVGAEVTTKAVREIYTEVDRLSTDLVSDQELSRVKNYMLGEALRYFDGSFASADLLRNFITFGKKLNDYNAYIDAIHQISAAEIRDLAQKYFDTESFIEVVVGKKK